MEPQHPPLRDRFEVQSHLRNEHGWHEGWQTTADGSYLNSTSELLATHRELHQLAQLGGRPRRRRTWWPL
jgi:hypothetical protein